jgi:hypothetical protein
MFAARIHGGVAVRSSGMYFFNRSLYGTAVCNSARSCSSRMRVGWFFLRLIYSRKEVAGVVCLFILSIRLSAVEPHGPALEIYSMLCAFIFACLHGGRAMMTLIRHLFAFARVTCSSLAACSVAGPERGFRYLGPT